MKLIIAIIQPTKLSSVREALVESGIDNVTVCDAVGYGRQRGQTAAFRGAEYRVDLIRKVELEIVVRDEVLHQTIDILCRVARTGARGEIGDGKIFVLPLAELDDPLEF
jgi:nitrogen regulatory protein P-II 1